MTHVELSVMPEGSDGELLHEVGNPLPLTIVGWDCIHGLIHVEAEEECGTDGVSEVWCWIVHGKGDDGGI